MSVWSIVVAAGSGTRFGGPKQLAPLAGRRVIDWSVDPALAVSSHVVVVVPAELVVAIGDTLAASPCDGVGTATISVVAGGATRSDSVRCGLAHVPDDASVVVVHDGAPTYGERSSFCSGDRSDRRRCRCIHPCGARDRHDPPRLGRSCRPLHIGRRANPAGLCAKATASCTSVICRGDRRCRPGRSDRWQGGARGWQPRESQDHKSSDLAMAEAILAERRDQPSGENP